MPTDDDAFGPARIRQDMRYMGPAYLFRVKSPAESKGPWDYCALVDSLPGDAISLCRGTEAGASGSLPSSSRSS